MQQDKDRLDREAYSRKLFNVYNDDQLRSRIKVLELTKDGLDSKGMAALEDELKAMQFEALLGIIAEGVEQDKIAEGRAMARAIDKLLRRFGSLDIQIEEIRKELNCREQERSKRKPGTQRPI